MTEKLSARQRGAAPDDDELLAAACEIVAADGWDGLTLRPLAARLHVSVAVLSNHVGARADVIAAICRAAHDAELQVFSRWRRLLERLATLAAPVAADLADSILDDLAGAQRGFSLLFLEVLQAASWDTAVREAAAPWMAARQAFWRQFGHRAGLPASLLDTGWLDGYFTDELAHSVALNQLPSFRLLRRVCLRRLFSGLMPASADDPDQALFDALFDELDYAGDQLNVIHGEHGTTGWVGRAARACAFHITERGAVGLTHRVIAAQAEVPLATLSYRFPSQQDLLLGGLQYIIANLLRVVDEGAGSGALARYPARVSADDVHGLDVGRATFAVAIAASRLPLLIPCAADMRRRRGINLLQVLRALVPPLAGVDGLAAQVMAVGIHGLGHQMPPGAAADRSRALAYAAALAFMRSAPTFEQPF